MREVIDGNTPSELTEESLALAKEIYKEVNLQLYEAVNNTAIANVHAWLLALIKNDTSPVIGCDFDEPIYGHCQTILVSEGRTVTKGQTIATIGSTGNSAGPHLYFEVIEGA